MAKGNKIERRDIADDKIFDIGIDYAKSLEPAIDANEKWAKSFADIKKLALEYSQVEQQFKVSNGRKQFLASKEKEKELTEQVIVAQKEQDRTEKALITTIERKSIATESTNKKLIEERLEVNRLNKAIKEEAVLNSNTSRFLEKITVLRARAARSVQDLVAKQALGKRLSDQEQKELAESTVAFTKYDLAIKKARITTGQFQENVGNYPKQLKVVGNAFRQLLPVVGLASGLKLAFDFAKEARQLNIEAKGVNFAFDQIAKRGIDVESVLLRVKSATRGALSDLDIKKSIVEFDNFGLSVNEIDSLLEFVSVRAAQTGKSFEHLRDSLVEGLSKESKLRIDNLGISTQELNAELEKTPNFVEAVANIAKREIKEAGNILEDAANAQQTWNADLQNFKLLVGNRLVGGFSDTMYQIGSNIIRALTPTKEINEELEDQTRKVISLQKNLEPLIDEYESLEEKTELSKDEQERMKVIIGEVADIVPSAITQFDEYGNAISISADKARDFISTQKALLVFRNQEALKSQKEQLEQYTKTVENYQRALKNVDSSGNIIKSESVSSGVGGVSTVTRKATDEEIKQLQAGLAKYQTLLAGVEESIDQLSGDYLDKYIAREKAKTEATLKELQERAKALKIDITDKTADELRKLIAEAERKLDDPELKRRQEQFREAEKKAAFELSKFLQENKIDELNEIAEAEEFSFESRTEALGKALDEEVKLNDFLLKEKLKGLKVGSKQYENEVEQSKQREYDLVEKYNRQIIDLGVEKIQTEANIWTLQKEKQLEEELQKENEAFSAFFELYDDKEKAIEEHEKRVAAIKKKYAVEALQDQIKVIETLLKAEDLSAEKRAEYERKLAGIKREVSDITTEKQIDDNQKRLEKEKQVAERIEELNQDLKDALIDLGNTIFDNRIANIDREIERSDDKYDKLLDNENLSAEQQKAIEDQKEQDREKLEKKRIQEERRAAIFNKLLSASKIGISTAEAIMKNNATLGTVLAAPINALTIAIGAAQLATVLGTQIPQYAEGTDNHPGGLAEVAERQPEVITEPGKKPYIQYQRAILDLPAGTKVAPSLEEYQRMMRSSIMTSLAIDSKNLNDAQATQIFNMYNDKLIDEMKLTRRAIEKNKTNVFVKQTKVPDFNHALYKLRNTNWNA